MMKIGEKVKRIMKEKNMTQKDLALKTNTTEASISRYLNDERLPRADVVLNFANALGISTDELLKDSNLNFSTLSPQCFLTRSRDEISDRDKLKIIKYLAGDE